jgi:hypothetical protein
MLQVKQKDWLVIVKIALLAPNLGGHRAYWLKQILAGASERGVQVVAYTVEGKVNAECLNTLGLEPENMVFEENPRTLIARWCLDVNNDSHLGICLEADRILHKFFFVGGRYRLLIMRPYLESRSLFGITRFLVKKILAAALNPRNSIEIARLSIPYAHKRSAGHHWVRDDFNTDFFLDSETEVKIPEELLSIAKSHEIVSVLGYLDLRKNPIQVCKVFEQLRLRDSNQICLLFAGEQTESFKLELKKIKNKKNMIQIDRVLTDGEYRGVIQASKATLLIYSNHGPSGIVLNSLAIGTPVLLQGGRRWRNLQNILGGAFRVEKKNFGKLVDALGEIRALPHSSKVQILTQEPIPSLGSFIFGNTNK